MFCVFVFFLSAVDWMFVFPQIIYGNLMPTVIVLRGGAFGWCLGRESGAHMNGISALIKETPQSSLVPFAIWGYSKKDGCLGSGRSPDTESASAFILDFTAFRTVRNKFVVYRPPSLWHFLLQKHKWMEMLNFVSQT